MAVDLFEMAELFRTGGLLDDVLAPTSLTRKAFLSLTYLLSSSRCMPMTFVIIVAYESAHLPTQDNHQQPWRRLAFDLKELGNLEKL